MAKQKVSNKPVVKKSNHVSEPFTASGFLCATANGLLRFNEIYEEALSDDVLEHVSQAVDSLRNAVRPLQGI